jgi:DNA adenine methylase
MKYLGGKHRLGKKIAIVLNILCDNTKCKTYLEPFCGALGVFRHMTHYKKSIASDLHPDIIALWKSIKNGTFKPPPRKITDRYYNKVKNMNSPHHLKGFVGFLCSWNGMYFAGLAKYKNTDRDPRKEAINDIKKIKPLIQKPSVKFYNKSYDKFKPNNALIYCDPPYKNTIGYENSKQFDHAHFWDVIREWSKNNVVLVSEERAPKDFRVIWKQEYARGAGFKSSKIKVVQEKLFIHKSLIEKYDLKMVKKQIKESLNAL